MQMSGSGSSQFLILASALSLEIVHHKNTINHRTLHVYYFYSLLYNFVINCLIPLCIFTVKRHNIKPNKLTKYAHIIHAKICISLFDAIEDMLITKNMKNKIKIISCTKI